MRIGIDTRELAGRATGVGRYLEGLLREWAAGTTAAARVHDFVLYAPEPIALPNYSTRVVPGSGGTWWEQVQAPRAARADRLDVWFAPAYSAPLRLDIPVVVAIHDLSFAAHPEWFTLREGARRRWLVRQSARKARAVITISQFSRRELIERLGVADEKIHVIPPGVGTGSWEPGAGGWDRQRPVPTSESPANSAQRPAFSVQRPAPSAQRLAPSPQPPAPSPDRVLFVGSLFNRRHVLDLIRAFAPIARARPAASLDIVGDNRTFPHEDPRRTIAAEGLDGRVRWHAYVTDGQLRDLYAQARAFAFLSEYEGLGLTPLEALAAGVPPVLLDTPVAHESCGDAAVYVPLGDLGATTRALESVLFDEAVRARILAAAPSELSRYDWPRAAAKTLSVITAAL